MANTLMTNTFRFSLDYLMGQGPNAKLDTKNLHRIAELEALEEGKKKTLYNLIDTYIRDARARSAYVA
jgi:hypothetical protein